MRGGINMKGEPGTSRGFKFFCMVVLCLSLIVGGAYFVNKCAFADENDKWPGWGYNSPNMSFNYTDFNQNGFYNYFQYGFPYLTPSGAPAVTPTPTETPVVTPYFGLASILKENAVCILSVFLSTI